MKVKNDAEEPPADDPKRLIEQVAAMGDDFPGPAEDLLLSWILSLDHRIDASIAAQHLLERYAEGLAVGDKDRPLRRLLILLQETASAKISTTDKRRKGRRARRS